MSRSYLLLCSLDDGLRMFPKLFSVRFLFVFLPSFIFVIGGTHYIEKVRDNRTIQAFLAGVSAAVVGVIAVVSLDLIPEAIVGWPSFVIAAMAFLLIVWLKRDVALVAVGAMAGGIIYSLVRAFA